MSRTLSRSMLGALALLLAFAWSQPAIVRAADNAAGANAAPAAKETNKAKGRLPSYYSKVVDGQQREKIYAIQKTYGPQIAQLQAQLKELTQKRDAEVNALLTPEQRERFAALRAEARQAAAKKAAAAKPADAKPAADAATANAAPASK